MAKDNREFVRGIRALTAKAEGGRLARSMTYVSGMEDELAAAYTQKELDAMVARGDITGNWKSTAKPVAPAAVKPTAPAK